MKTKSFPIGSKLVITLCALILSACGTGFKTPEITVPGFTIPPFTFQKDTIRQRVDVTTHTTPAGIQSYTLDTVARTPHKARVRIATVNTKGDALFLRDLWNASIAITP